MPHPLLIFSQSLLYAVSSYSLAYLLKNSVDPDQLASLQCSQRQEIGSVGRGLTGFSVVLRFSKNFIELSMISSSAFKQGYLLLTVAEKRCWHRSHYHAFVKYVVLIHGLSSLLNLWL